jgi:hypothetical protein
MELGSTSAFRSVRERHSLRAVSSRQFCSPSSHPEIPNDEVFPNGLPSQSRHIHHLLSLLERDSPEVKSPYKNAWMVKDSALKPSMQNIDVGSKELFVLTF